MEFPSNSSDPTRKSPAAKKSKDAQPKKVVEKITTGEAIKRPKSIGERAKSLFIGSEIKTAGTYMVVDVLVPALRNLVVDATTKGIERLIYGESPSPRRSQYGGGQSRFSYHTPVQRGYTKPYDDRPPSRSAPSRRRQNVDDVIIKSRQEAELVIERLTDIVERYDHATLADLYDLVGFPSAYTDNDWGWFALGSVTIRQVREGYLIDLPPVEPVK